MVYLISNSNKKIKVGYSANTRTWENRKSMYITHNPDTQFVDVDINGDKDDENALHMALHKFHYKNEWYYDCEEVRDIWENYKKYTAQRTQDMLDEIKNGD